MLKFNLDTMSTLIERFHRLSRVIGWVRTCIYMGQKIFRINKDYVVMLSKESQYPLFGRPNTSDTLVFEQIFIEREYSCLDDLSNVDLIIDCGANVGYTSAYFLTHFPKCKVICIEPDSSNFMLLQKNLAPYKERVKLMRAGIWSHSTNLKILETPYGDGGAWSVQVKECKPGEVAEMPAVDIESLLRESGQSSIKSTLG